MELTRSHLRQLQRQLVTSHSEGSNTSTLSDSRIELLLIHEDQIPSGHYSSDPSDEDGEITNINTNSSIVLFQADDNTESIANINQTQLQLVKVSVKNDVDGISKIFDPDNTSLLYLDRKKQPDQAPLKNLDTNTTSPTKPRSKSKIPIPETKSSQIRVSKPLKQKSSALKQNQINHNGSSTQFDLRFPKLDQLILRLAEQRSLS